MEDPKVEATKLWEACSSYTGANHQGWCEMNFIKFWEAAQSEAKKERNALRAALEEIVFIGTKGTSKMWPEKTLTMCVELAGKALNKKD